MLVSLLLFVGAPTIADESPTKETALPEGYAVIEQQPDHPATPKSQPASKEEKQAPQGSEPPTAPPDEPPTDKMPEEDADQTPLPPEEEEPSLEPTPDPSEESLTEASELLLDCTVRWGTDVADGLLFWGDTLTLEAEISAVIGGKQLQWQVATNPTADLDEDEPEWVDIAGAHGLTYAFPIEDGMQTWRWRLCITPSEGEPIYSDEIMLPAIEAVGEVLGVLDGEDLPEDQVALPVANITFAADVPDEEITYGTEITLTAEIENPQEGMQLQWQYLPVNAEPAEEAWLSVKDATESCYAYMLDEENTGWQWRLLITVPEPPQGESTGLTGNE